MSEWIENGAEGDWGPPGKAATAVQAIGVAAIPHLLREIQVSDGYVRKKLCGFASDREWMPRLVPAEKRRGGALWAFSVLGSNAAPACGGLVKIMRSNKANEVRTSATDALAYIGPGASTAVPALLRGLTDRSPEVRAGCAYALSKTQINPILIVPPLIERLSDSNSWVCLVVLNALGSLKEAATPALPSISNAWNRLDVYGKKYALGSVREINLEKGKGLFELAAKATNILIHSFAVGVLSRATNQPHIAVPLILNFSTERSQVRPFVLARALGNFGTNAQMGVPLLLSFLSQTNVAGAAHIAKALYAIDPEAAAGAGWTKERIDAGEPRKYPRRRGGVRASP